MGETRDCRGVAIHPEEILNLVVTSIHHDNRDFSVRINECGGEERTPARGAVDSPCSRSDKPREVADVVVRVDVGKLARLRVSVDRGEAEIPDVVRSALLVKKNVP